MEKYTLEAQTEDSLETVSFFSSYKCGGKVLSGETKHCTLHYAAT